MKLLISDQENETNFRMEKMNISPASTKNYEMNSPADPAKTKPISPGLKRQLYRIYSSTHLLVNPSAAAISNRLSLTPDPRPLIPLLPLYPHPRYNPTTAPTRPILCPSKPPNLTSKLSQTFTLSHTYSSAIPPLFLSFSKLFTL